MLRQQASAMNAPIARSRSTSERRRVSPTAVSFVVSGLEAPVNLSRLASPCRAAGGRASPKPKERGGIRAGLAARR
jgi:hypothetical protein